MTDQFDRLRTSVLNELNQQNPPAVEVATSIQRTKRFAAFLTARLLDMGMSPDEFARRLKIELALAESLLDGLLPESEVDDDWLTEIAAVIERQPNILRALLGRSIHHDQDETFSSH